MAGGQLSTPEAVGQQLPSAMRRYTNPGGPTGSGGPGGGAPPAPGEGAPGGQPLLKELLSQSHKHLTTVVLRQLRG